MTFPDSYVDFQRALHSIPDTTGLFACPSQVDSPMHLFTDGSCVDPQWKTVRVATWAVCLAELHQHSFVPVAAGGLPGGFQSILRAEITAAIAACKFGCHMRCPFYVWTDNQHVYECLRKMIRGTYVVPKVSIKDHDLWTQLFAQVVQAGPLLQSVVKVRSREDESQYSCLIERWAIQGNESADFHAGEAYEGLPRSLRVARTKLRADFLLRRRMTECLHNMFIAIGLRSVALKRGVAASDENVWQQTLDEPRQHQGDILTEASIVHWTKLPGKHTMREIAEDLCAWLHCLTAGDDLQPFWVTSAHLLVHYQQTRNKLGFKFNQSTNQWNFVQSHVEKSGFSFPQIANWLQAAIRCYARLGKMPYQCNVRLPDGTCYRCWAPCLLTLMSSTVFWQLDQTMRQHGAVAVTSVRKSFRDWRPFGVDSA